jgi:hypothetical protein
MVGVGVLELLEYVNVLNVDMSPLKHQEFLAGMKNVLNVVEFYVVLIKKLILSDLIKI